MKECDSSIVCSARRSPSQPSDLRAVCHEISLQRFGVQVQRSFSGHFEPGKWSVFKSRFRPDDSLR